MSAFRRRLARRLSMALLVTGGLVYASWVLQFVLPVHIDPVTSFISELSAVGQPFRRVFRTLDLIGGALLLVGGATAWWQSRRWPGVWAPLVVLGVCIVLEALLPLDASFTDDLPDPGTGSWWARITEPHGVISFVETNAFLVLLVTCSLALRRIDAPLLRRRALATVGVLAALSGLVDAARPPPSSSTATPSGSAWCSASASRSPPPGSHWPPPGCSGSRCTGAGTARPAPRP